MTECRKSLTRTIWVSAFALGTLYTTLVVAMPHMWWFYLIIAPIMIFSFRAMLISVYSAALLSTIGRTDREIYDESSELMASIKFGYGD